MPSVKRIQASDGTANASQATVTRLRSALATTIQVDTVAGIYAGPEGFYASMGTPHTFTDPITSETITVISEATAVDFRGHIDTGNIIIDEIAPGYTDNGNEVGDIIVIRPVTEWANNIYNLLNESLDDDGSLKRTAVDAYIDTTNSVADHVSSGGVVAQSAGLLGTFSNIGYYIGATKYSKSSIANKTYTASKDTYVDIDTSGAVTYVEVANGATTGMTLTANSVRVAKVVTNSSTITSVTQTGFDPLGNPIKPTSALNSASLSLQDQTTSLGGSGGVTTTSNNYVNIGTALKVIVPASGRLIITVAGVLVDSNNGAALGILMSGANSISPGDDRVPLLANTTASQTNAGAATMLVTGLTPGLTTIQAQFRRFGGGAGTSTVSNGRLTVASA